MTIQGLLGDGKYNLINMLKRLLEHDSIGNLRIEKLFLFTHPYIEHLYGYDDETPDIVKSSLHMSILLRTGFIVATLIGILETYLGHPAEPILIAARARSKQSKAEHIQATRALRAEHKKLGIRVDDSQCKEMAAANQLNACYSCATITDDRTTLKPFGRCQLVWYCSSVRQRKDWADHKKFCGQQNFDPNNATPSGEPPAEFIGCPGTAPGFVRTPALWHQIWDLSKPDSQKRDYHFDTTPKKTRSVVILHPPGARLVFLVARHRAMASGSLPAIYMMYTIVEYQERARLHELTRDQIRGQFEREYRVTITPSSIKAAGPFEPPTKQELAEEEAYCLQRLSNVEH
ncbi:hypothetical protein C8J57DRAFT_1672388 [Mycena rebaudengoi]|nr:hypothetical protein C8J57DRAFT_1672388 [Mycena rebaudengoi]